MLVYTSINLFMLWLDSHRAGGREAGISRLLFLWRKEPSHHHLEKCNTSYSTALLANNTTLLLSIFMEYLSKMQEAACGMSHPQLLLEGVLWKSASSPNHLLQHLMITNCGSLISFNWHMAHATLQTNMTQPVHDVQKGPQNYVTPQTHWTIA